MKKLIIAAVCGLCLFAGAAAVGTSAQVAGSGAALNVKM